MGSTPAATGILQPGRNCATLEQAERVSFIIDGADYFAAFRAAARRARHSIFIVGWDVDSRIRLVADGAGDGLPESLGDFLRALLRRTRGLRPAERRSQVRRLLDHLAPDATRALVLMGDLNEWFLWGRPLRWLHAVFAETPSLATFPSGRPLFALDRLWVRPRSLLTTLSVHRSATARIASDHLPLVATLRL